MAVFRSRTVCNLLFFFKVEKRFSLRTNTQFWGETVKNFALSPFSETESSRGRP